MRLNLASTPEASVLFGNIQNRAISLYNGSYAYLVKIVVWMNFLLIPITLSFLIGLDILDI